MEKPCYLTLMHNPTNICTNNCIIALHAEWPQKKYNNNSEAVKNYNKNIEKQTFKKRIIYLKKVRTRYNL